MQAAVYTRYGGPEVVNLAQIARPEPGKGEILVRVGAAGVTTADWRMRAAAFPGMISAIAGRLMFGLRRPRNPVLGDDFAGTVAVVGADVTGFAPGDRVFGFAGGGAHAEYVVVPATGAVAPTPHDLTDEQAAALPFGGLAALAFLDRFARVQTGERVLVIGASGGVGAYAVQIARALRASVSAVASGAAMALVKDLGAQRVHDYRDGDPPVPDGGYDVILDTFGALDYARAAPMLAAGGRFVPLNFGLRDLWLGRRAKANGHRQILRVNGDTRAGLDRLSEMIAAGQLRPVIDRIYPFDAIRAAYAHVETRHRKGAVVLRMGPAASMPQMPPAP